MNGTDEAETKSDFKTVLRPSPKGRVVENRPLPNDCRTVNSLIFEF